MTMTSARIAGLFYLLVLMTGAAAILADGRFIVADLLAMVCYGVITALFYDVFKPVSRRLSLTAALVSLAGCISGALGALFQLAPAVVLKAAAPLFVFTQELQSLAVLFVRWSAQASVTSLVLLGVYCLLIAWLMMKAAFRPARSSQPCF